MEWAEEVAVVVMDELVARVVVVARALVVGMVAMAAVVAVAAMVVSAESKGMERTEQTEQIVMV